MKDVYEQFVLGCKEGWHMFWSPFLILVSVARKFLKPPKNL